MKITSLFVCLMCLFVGNCSVKSTNQPSYHSPYVAASSPVTTKTSTPQSSIQINTESPIQAISLIIGGIFVFCLVNGATIYLYSRYKKNKN